MTHKKKLGHVTRAILATAALSTGTAHALQTAAGEPDSLQTRMFADDFERALTEADVSETAGPVIGAALEIERLKVNGRVIEGESIPLSYTVRSDLDPRRQTTTSLNLSHSRSNSIDTYSAVGGIAFRRPITDHWTVVPAASYGYVDSGRAAGETSGTIYAANVASIYKMSCGRFDIAIANQLGHYRTLEFRSQAFGGRFRPDVNNTVARNGIVVSAPTVINGRKLSTELSYTRTDLLTGHRITAVDYYNEVSLTLGNNKRLANGRSFVRGGLSYVDGQGDVRGLRAKIGYWF